MESMHTRNNITYMCVCGRPARMVRYYSDPRLVGMRYVIECTDPKCEYGNASERWWETSQEDAIVEWERRIGNHA